MKTLRAATALGDTSSKFGSKSSCINAYIPVSRRISPGLTGARDAARRVL